MEGKGNSKVLLQLEANNSPSALESKLLVCKNNELLQSQTTKSQPPNGESMPSSVPKSQVLGKVKDFLGVISEANERLQVDAKDSSKDYDIEVLTGNESEYIEMDLMLGVADLHTPEAIAAAESAIASYQPMIPLAGSSSGTESEDSSDDSDDDNDESDDDDDDDNDTCSPTKGKRSKPDEDNLPSESSRNRQSKKRPKIIELP
ncbi:histone deacetylase HDT2 [Cornus florida]|uniref:histone deacetylase HDT2 n=1 Tax=Cornus florida TaxID=4283 RepID=UPI00289EEC2F|nr:histone deacetylase HDT2 [Cornus florida]